jgi:ADP-heptose:LPS heptosyltransferase
VKIADHGFYDSVRASRRILALAFGGLGDVIHSVPALRTIRKNFPAARFDVLTPAVCVDFLRLVDGIDDLIPYYGRKAGWTGADLRLFGRLLRSRYDLCINLWGSNHASLVALASWARVRLGRMPYESYKAGWRRCHTHIGVYPHRRDPMYQQWLNLLDHLGFTPDPRFALHPPPQMLAAAGIDPAQRQRYIHVSPCAQPEKEPPIASLAAVLDALTDEFPALSVVLSCAPDPRQTQRTAALAEALRCKPLALFPGTLGTGGAYALIEAAALHLSADTGPLHMAFAAGTPSVSSVHRRIPPARPATSQHRDRARRCRRHCQAAPPGPDRRLPRRAERTAARRRFGGDRWLTAG